MEPLAVGLQEWAACCRALADGRVALTLRKGGIHERGGGVFAPEHDRFLLLPTHLHQEAERMAPALAGEVAASQAGHRPGTIVVDAWAEVARVWRCEELARVLALGAELPWSPAEVEARFRYRDRPLIHVLLLRVHRLPAPAEVPDDPAYAGCRSWITLRQPLGLAGSRPVLDDAAFAARAAAVARLL